MLPSSRVVIKQLTPGAFTSSCCTWSRDWALSRDRLRTEGRISSEDLTPERFRQAVQPLKVASRGTTHISVADDDGNVASLSSSNGEGCGYVVPGTGLMLNNMLGEEDLHPGRSADSPAGERVASIQKVDILTTYG